MRERRSSAPRPDGAAWSPAPAAPLPLHPLPSHSCSGSVIAYRAGKPRRTPGRKNPRVLAYLGNRGEARALPRPQDRKRRRGPDRTRWSWLGRASPSGPAVDYAPPAATPKPRQEMLPQLGRYQRSLRHRVPSLRRDRHDMRDERSGPRAPRQTGHAYGTCTTRPFTSSVM
jgi:hypothetical protein